MTTNIFEEESTSENQSSGGDAKIRKQARQLAYDVRYKVKQSLSKGEESNDASLKRAYLQQLNSSPAPGAVKRVAKKMLVGESYDFVDITETAKESVDKILSSVFVKKTELEDVDGNSAFEVTDFVFGEEKSDREKKYKVRVTGKKGKKTYVRMADRKDIDKLRKGDEVSSVEMTGYGVPIEEKGKKKVVKKAKKDFDGDGKLESPEAEYKGSKDKAIKKAVAKEDIADILARLEKKRISKGGDPDESPLGKKTGQAMKAQQDKQRKKAGLKTEDVEIEEGVYEKQKTKEVMGALKKRDLKKDVKKKIAADIVKRKGDTSKSDDRYAYEDNVWDKVADMLTELGKLNDVEFRVEGYQRNPEKGEKEDRKYEKVRGERTPMPPRGNKRREEFERWYAANVR